MKIDKVKLIIGIISIGFGILFFFYGNNQAQVLLRTYSDTKNFNSMVDATQYQNIIAQQAEDENAIINSNITTSNNQSTVNWTVEMPKTAGKFAYGKSEKSKAGLSSIIAIIALITLGFMGIDRIYYALPHKSSKINEVTK